jgi:o-succinylbenzoate---CoA ligase
MNAGAIVAYEIVAGENPLSTLCSAWSRGERVLLVSPNHSAFARQQLLAVARATNMLQTIAHDHAAQKINLDACPPTASVIIETSGSSGAPCLIELGIDALVASAQIGARAIAFGAGDLWHASLPATHIGGLMIHVRSLVLGGGVRYGVAPKCWSDLNGVTHISLVAAQLARLLDDPHKPPPTLKAVMLGGGPSSQSLRDRALRQGLPMFATYGMTETASQVATGPIAIGDAATLAGAPLPGIQISIDSSNNEILIASPTLARGTLVNGALVPFTVPLRTRDVGSIDTQGRLHIDGRLDAMFISGGRNIQPEIIERALADLPCVNSSCVIGIAHEKWGMRPIAFVQLGAEPGVSFAAFLRERLEPHLIPDAFYEIPIEETSRMKHSRADFARRLAQGERFRQLD